MMTTRTIAPAAALAIALAACTTTPTAAPVASPSPSASPSSPAPGDPDTARIYYVESSLGSFVLSFLDVELAAATPEARLRAATEAPPDDDLSTVFPDGVGFTVTVADGLATVDWAPAVLDASVGAEAEIVGIQAAAWTLLEDPTVDEVAFTVDGRTEGETPSGMIEDWWGHTALADLPLERDEDVLAPIIIETPAHGAPVSGRTLITGQASTFEANVELRLRAPDGTVTSSTFTTATIGAPERGTWRIRRPFPDVDAPQTWRIEAFERSAEDGRITFLTSRTVTVVPS